MPNYDIVFLAPAFVELDEIADMHLALAGETSAEKITNSIMKLLENLSQNPFMGMVAKDTALAQQGFRVLLSGNYICFYKVSTDVIEIYHIVDARKDYPNLLHDLI